MVIEDGDGKEVDQNDYLSPINQQYLVANVEVPYDLRFMPLVLDWVAGIVEVAGGKPQEVDGLRFALEETIAFIISSYPDAEEWELICVGIQILLDGMAEITVSNAGPPVHLEKIPQYNPVEPTELNIDGLWYFLACKKVDDLEFKNLGMAGWRAILKQQLTEPSYTKLSLQEGDVSSKPAKKIKFSSRFAIPKDSGELIDLTYDTYRYSYPGEEFYHESIMRQAFEDGSLISIIVESNDIIAGSSSVTFSSKTPHCGYLGALMVRRDFRHTRAIMYLVRETTEFMKINQHNVDLYFSTMVTEHAASQKAGEKGGVKPLALLLSVGAAVDYRGMALPDSNRETFLLSARLTKPSTLSVLYVPKRHHFVIKPLLEQVGCTSNLSDKELAIVEEGTSFSVAEDSTERTAYITVDQIGQQWVKQLRKKVFTLNTKGLYSIIILVPAWCPLPFDIEQEMVGLNAIFTGLKPLSTAKYYLVYNVLACKVDFESIKIANPIAQELKKHVHKLYCEVVDE